MLSEYFLHTLRAENLINFFAKKNIVNSLFLRCYIAFPLLFQCFFILLISLASSTAGFAISKAEELPPNKNLLSPEEQAWLQGQPVIRARVGNLPPYHYWDNGPKGISVDFLNLIAKRMGFQVNYVHDMSWANALENIRQHQQVDLILAAKRTPERESFMVFSKDYLKLPWVIFTRQETRNIFALEDLFGRQVAIEEGYLLHKRLSKEFPKINLQLHAYAPDALTALSDGRADAYVGNLASASYHIAQRGLNNLKVAAPIGLGRHDLAFAMRDDWLALATILNKGLLAIPPEERSAIHRKYFSVEIDHSAAYSLLRKVLLGIVLLLVFILLWNYLLRRKVAERTAQFYSELASRRRGEAKYRRLISSLGSDFIFFTLNTEGLLTYISPSVTDVLGYTPEECKHVHYRYFHTDAPVSLQAIAQTDSGLKGERHEPFEAELKHKNGSLVLVETTESPIFDNQGKVIALEGVVHNIGKRKRAERELQEHKQHLESLVEARTVELRKLSRAVEQSDSSIIITDLDGAIEFVNPAFMRSTGYTEQEILGQNLRILQSGVQGAAFYQRMWATLVEGDVWRGELYNKRKNGSLYWEFVSISPIKDERGNTTHYVAVKEDVTARKEAEQALRKSEEMFRGVVENAPVLIDAFDKHGRCILWNKQCEKTFGYTIDEVNAEEEPLALFYPDAEVREKVMKSITSDPNGCYKKWYPLTKTGEQLVTFWANIKVADGVVISIGYDDTEQQRQQAELEELNARMEKIASRLPGMIYQMKVRPDGSSCIPYASDAIWDLFHVTAEEVRENDSRVYANINPADLELMAQSIERCKVSLEPWQQEFRVSEANGKERWLLGSSSPERTPDGGLLWHGFITDISEQKVAQNQLRLAASVFEHSQQSIMITSADNRIIDVNPARLELTGYTREELLGKNPRLFSSGLQSEDFYSNMWQTLDTEGYWEGELWNVKKSGELFAERQTINTVEDTEGHLQHYVSVASDITHLKKQEANLEQLAYNDALTGLPNRRLLNDRMQQALVLAKRHEKLVAVCYLALDGFKPINDNYGHKAGDQVLIETAERLQLSVRTGDTVSRLGGDEFVLLILDLHNTNELEQIIARVLQTISQPYKLSVDAVSVSVSVSIGIALYPEDNSEAETLLRHADQAMYIAKRGGKNCYHFFDPDEEQRISEEQLMQRDLENALSDEQLVLFYQPKVNMRTGEVVGLEALLRWQHPEMGLLTPDAFLSTIERQTTIVTIGNWVLRQAMLQIRVWQAQGIELTVSVNIATKQIEQPDFVTLLKALLNEFNDVPASLLELEILENAAMNDMCHVRKVMLECSEMGIHFALDDFGTGYSSLTYLKSLPAEVIKIDQSFVRSLLHNPDDIVIVQGILGLAKAFNRKSVAEGVETVQHGILLLNLGCELGQGYGIARPMPASALPDWLSHYKVAEEWLETKESDSSNREYVLLNMATEHHRLVARVLYAIEQQLPSLLPKQVEDYHACEFGQWLEGDGGKWFGELPEFKQLLDQHLALHKLCQQAAALLIEGDSEALHLVAVELKDMRAYLLDSLHQLRYEARNIDPRKL
ncbi:MAG: PAS domain S-box protein [Methyloprofundus sp.]|nr:PAS domain S-box protein [Methyloprofundus sp.]